jgi:D-alanine-D-alanine ligase
MRDTVESPCDQQKIKPRVQPEKRTFGPIDDLEAHVSSDWWCRIFNANYLKTDADVVDDPSITRHEIQLFLSSIQLQKDHLILDLCCGQGRHCLELARQGFKNVYGLDRSHYLIQRARLQTKREGLNIKFKEGDARKLPYPACKFDCVTLLGNSFGYFETINDDLLVLKEIFRVIKPWGKILIDVSDGDYLQKHFSPRSWEWIDKKHFVCRERSLSIDKQRLISREVISHVEKGVVADQFYAERLYSRETLSNLLENAGFKDICFAQEIKTHSQRNQDLGMMEQRVIVTAVVKKAWTPPVAKKGIALKHVAVLLGDPQKTDTLKPSSVFDDDDFYTIDQMKSVLSRLPMYKFTYFNNHDSLINDLVKNRAKIDFIFNLCDEGFNNMASKELHVPALLEMLNIPYTGAGPQCLAHCYDKSLVRGIANEMGIMVPLAFFIKAEDNVFDLSFPFPVLVKPNFGDSSLGITQKSVAYNIEDLVNAIQRIRDQIGFDKPILVEEFLEGADLSVGIIGNPPESYTILPIIEEDYSHLPKELPRICGYEAKWLPESPYGKIRSVPANLPDEAEKYIEACCLKLFERLECRDYARVDWRLDKAGNPKLLEVNPNPGWCWDGHLAKMAKLADISYARMVEDILKVASERLWK